MDGSTHRHRTADELDRALDTVRAAPPDRGSVGLVVRRPAPAEREVLAVGMLTPDEGLVGDDWSRRPSRHSDDGGPHPLMQLNVMPWRAVSLLADDDGTRALAGDQLYLDLDLSVVNLPPGSRIGVGTAVIEVTDRPHRGCAKFRERFGDDALRWVNSPEGSELRLRGLNARVVSAGEVRPGDVAVVLGRGPLEDGADAAGGRPR